MKFTTGQLIELAKEIGFQDAEVVEVDTDSDYNKDTALQTVDAARAKVLNPQFKTDMLKELTGQATRSTALEVTKRLKAMTGIDSSELKDLPWEEQLEKAVDYYKSTLSKDTEGLREEMKSMAEKHNEAIELSKKQIKETEDGWKSKWNSREIRSTLESVLKDAPILEGADRGVIAEDFQNHLVNKYHLSYDEAAKAVNLFTKDNPEMPAFNETKTATIQLIDEAKNFLTPRGLWQTDMRNKKPPTGGEEYKPANPGGVNTDVDPMAAQNAARASYMATVQP
jgi:hypothetical protein